MSILASLARAYQRLPNAPPFGFSPQNIGVIVGLNEDGTVASVSPWLDGEGKKRKPRPMLVPQPEKRTVAIAPNFLWDKSSYVLGVTAGEGKRSALEHQAFKERHERDLADADDAGLLAFLRFLRLWTPEQFSAPLWTEEMKDQNIVFALESDRREKLWLHDRPAAKALWARVAGKESDAAEICLVSGEPGPVARLHPSIKGVWGAQSSGAAVVSFNLDAFTSYGHEQGDNAPISEASAFAYTTALNRFLERDSRHRIQIGDASTVFWAHAAEPATEDEAVNLFREMFDPVAENAAESKKLQIMLHRLVKGDLDLDLTRPDLMKDTQFYVLGLSPNAARISVRYSFADSFGVLAENYRHYVNDLRFEPRSTERTVTLKRLLARTAPARIERNGQVKFDTDQIPSLLSGELFRAILTGDRFPGALLSQLLMRVRSDKLLDGLRISLIKAVITRAMRLEGRLPRGISGQSQEDYLVRSDPDDPNPARRLGRLFALVERAQLAALGDRVNATVKDKYLGTCAATPAQIMSKLLINAEQHHLKKLRNGHSDAEWIKDADHARKVGAGINRDIGRLAAKFEGNFPAQHSDEEQGFFLVGYYQERFSKAKGPDDGGAPTDDTEVKEGEE